MTSFINQRRSRVVNLALFLITISSLLVSHLVDGALTLELGANEEECFAVRTPADESAQISGSYDMLDDELSPDPVTVVLFDYSDYSVLWHSKPGAREGSFSVIGNGRYLFCIGNGSGGYKTSEDYNKEEAKREGRHFDDDSYDYSNKDGEDRNIGFNLRVKPLQGTSSFRKMQANTQDENDKSGPSPVDEQTDRMMDISMRFIDQMELLLDHQEYLKKRESNHRNLVENTFSMIMKWTVMEAIVLVIIAITQIMYLRKFFETKRFL